MAEVAEETKGKMHLVSICISEADRSRSYAECSLIVFSFEHLALRLKYTEPESIEMWKCSVLILFKVFEGKIFQNLKEL
jgi:hypothetical protein